MMVAEVPALAQRMGVSANTLQHKLNPNNATHHLHPAELVAMQQLSGNAAVLHAMAAALGYTCIPAVADQSGGDPVDAFMHQAAAQGKYVAAVADAMLVPAPSRNEVNRVARMAEDLIDTTTALLSVLRGRMPVTRRLPYQWYDTPNIRVGTYKDFEVLAHKNRLHVVDAFGLREGQVIRNWPNLRASTAVFCLERG